MNRKTDLGGGEAARVPAIIGKFERHVRHDGLVGDDRRVMLAGDDFESLQVLNECRFAFRRDQNRKEMPARFRSLRRRSNPNVSMTNAILIFACDLPSAPDPSVQTGKHRSAEYSRLQLIEPAVVPDDFVPVLVRLAVIAEHSGSFTPFTIFRENRAAIAERAQVLGRIETNRRDLARCSGRGSARVRSDRLRAVLDNVDLVLFADLPQQNYIQRVTKEMNRDEEADIGTPPKQIAAAIQIQQSVFVGVDEHRNGPQFQDRQSGGEGGDRRGQNRIAGLASQDAQTDFDCIQTARDADDMRNTPIGRESGFELPHFLTQDVPAARAGRAKGRDCIFLNVLPLALKVVGGNRLHANRMMLTSILRKMEARKPIEVRRLTEHDAEAHWKLRLHALETEPAAFGESPEEHRRSTISQTAERLRTGGEQSMVFGAFDGSTLIGTIGIYRMTGRKRNHKTGVWGMFVHEAHRGTGAGRALLEEAIRAARGMEGVRIVCLSVNPQQPAARSLYVSAGFRSWGLEPRALKVGDELLDEEHLVFEL